MRKYRAKRQSLDPDFYARKMWEYNLGRYGITPKDYEAMFRKQKGRCFLCGGKPNGRSKNRLHVDHDHKTGQVRALLCHSCNTGLGSFKHDPEILTMAIKYLKIM